SREGAVREMINWWQNIAGRVLGKLPPHGAHVHIGDGVLASQGDSVAVNATLTSPFLGRYVMSGAFRHDTLRARIARTTGAQPGSVVAVRSSSELALADYPSIAARAAQVGAQTIY